MAPMKRGRPTRPYDGESDEEEDGHRRESHKRRRQRADQLGQEDDSESEIELTSTQRQRYSARDEYERERDEAETDAEEDAAIERRATQDIQRARGKPMQNQVNEHGILESLFCTNFMCHTKLEVKFGPLINFIIGHNGSGKSAILTAVTLCLGGKATATNRGQSLKGFIKEGQESCMLQIKIKNQGDGAFRQDVYGNSIIVERHFNLAGTSGFKLKAANGKVISTKRAELDEITDFYSMQLDNPVNVLTQDQARQFLNNSTALDKYKFFMRGIQLEQLDHDYTLLADSLDAAEAHMDSIAGDKDQLLTKFKQAEEKVQRARQQETLRDKMLRYRNQMAWAQVEEQERLLEQAQENVEKADSVIATREEALTKSDEAFQALHKSFEEAQVKLDEVKNELPALEESQKEAQQIYEKKNAELIDLQTQQRDVKRQLDSAKKAVDKVQEEVDTERQRLEAADGGNHARQMQEIEQAEADLAEAHRKVVEHPDARERLDQQKNTVELKLRDAKMALRQKNDDVERAQATLRQLNDGQPKALSAYHTSIHGLLKAIERERRWKSKPIGPIGEHIRLLKPEWSSAIEVTLGNTLDAFIVETKADQVLLSGMMKSAGWRGQVFIGHKGRIDTTAQEPPQQFDTILKVLQIDNDLIRNQLIINHLAEQTMLIPDREQAMNTMYPGNNGAPPRNARICITHNPHRRGWCVRLAAGNNVRSDPVRHFEKTPRIRTDIQAQINIQRDLVAGLRREAQPLEDAVRGLQTDYQRITNMLTQHDKVGASLRLAQKTAAQKVQALKEQLEAAIPQDGRLDSLKDQLRQEEEERDHFQSQYDAASDARRGLLDEARELNKSVEAADARIASHSKNLDRMQKTLRKLADDRQHAIRAKNEAHNSLDHARAQKTEEEQNHAQQSENVRTFITEASQICRRVDVDAGETPTSLDAKLIRLQDQLKRAETELGGTQAQLTKAAADAKMALLRAERKWKSVNDLRHQLQLTLKERRFRWWQFRQQITVRARVFFGFLLSERQFRGRMEVQHKRKQLELRVEPDISISHSNQQGRGTKTLSGGEKSFSTICMLLALWESMGSPIRCLDEFDVFMDSVNRDISMNMIVTAARRSVGRQYVLISPQAMGNVSLAGDVKVIRLSDPERGGQRVLGGDGRLE